MSKKPQSSSIPTPVVSSSPSSSWVEQTTLRHLPATFLGVPVTQVISTFLGRVPVLLTLLMFQSVSSSILQHYDDLIQRHTVITLFLTMLVGSGGNAGNQATVRILTGLASKEYSLASAPRVILKESMVGLLLAVSLFVVGALRVLVFYDDSDHQETRLAATVAISVCLFFIVLCSVTVGALLPFVFLYVGIDPIHAGPSIQVAMDIIGVIITCLVCNALLL